MYRKDAQTDFLHKDSIDYALGFGDKDNSFWQGNIQGDLIMRGRLYINIYSFLENCT